MTYTSRRAKESKGRVSRVTGWGGIGKDASTLKVGRWEARAECLAQGGWRSGWARLGYGTSNGS